MCWEKVDTFRHPLCSARFFRLGMALTAKDSAQGKVAFDLIRALHSEELALEPMADHYWHADLVRRYISGSSDVKLYCRRMAVKKGGGSLTPPESDMRVKRIGAPRKSAARADKEYTRKMNRQGKPYQYGMLPDIFNLLNNLIERDLVPDEVWELVDYSTLKVMLGKGYNVELGAVDAKNWLRLAVALIFLSKEEEPWQMSLFPKSS